MLSTYWFNIPVVEYSREVSSTEVEMKVLNSKSVDRDILDNSSNSSQMFQNYGLVITCFYTFFKDTHRKFKL